MNIGHIGSVDEVVALACEALAREDAAGATDILDCAQPRFPLDSRLCVIRSLLTTHAGAAREGMQHLWRGLAAEPGAALCREGMIELVVPAQTDVGLLAKDFSLHSGERQTAGRLEDIRLDHRARYAFAAQWLRRQLPHVHRCCGLDVFAGNGYGSRLVADLTGARMVGLDGSSDAVEHAERHFSDHRLVFGKAVFPFELRPGLFDFAICFESIEHVEAPRELLEQVARTTVGPLIVSVPNDSVLKYATCGHQFQHHVRHFTRQALVDLMGSIGRPVVRAAMGQNVYCMDDGKIAGLLPESQMSLHPLREDSQFILLACAAA